MKLKTTWESIHFDRKKHFAWIFIGGRMVAVNDSKYKEVLRENYLNKRKFYEGTKIKKEQN